MSTTVQKNAFIYSLKKDPKDYKQLTALNFHGTETNRKLKRSASTSFEGLVKSARTSDRNNPAQLDDAAFGLASSPFQATPTKELINQRVVSESHVALDSHVAVQLSEELFVDVGSSPYQTSPMKGFISRRVVSESQAVLDKHLSKRDYGVLLFGQAVDSNKTSENSFSVLYSTPRKRKKPITVRPGEYKPVLTPNGVEDNCSASTSPVASPGHIKEPLITSNHVAPTPISNGSEHSGWTPINHHKEMKWEDEARSKKPSTLMPKPKWPTKAGDGVVWDSMIDPLWRLDTSLAFAAGRRRKAHERAEKERIDAAAGMGSTEAKRKTNAKALNITVIGPEQRKPLWEDVLTVGSEHESVLVQPVSSSLVRTGFKVVPKLEDVTPYGFPETTLDLEHWAWDNEEYWEDEENYWEDDEDYLGADEEYGGTMELIGRLSDENTEI